MTGATCAQPQEKGAAQPPQVHRPGWGLLLGLASAKLVILFVVGNRYGFLNDELHFLACGRRLAWGYVDHPPLMPLLARLAETIAGQRLPTPLELRWMSALASAGTVVLAGLIARELGGKRFAQGIAALAVLAMPLFLATGDLFQTTVFDQTLWALALWLVLRTLRTGQGHGWLLVGLTAGVGLEVKHTMALFGLGLAVALVATSAGRRHLATPWPWLGGALALALFAPNLLWQRAHGWPTSEFVRHNNAGGRWDWTFLGFLGWQFLMVGPGVALLLALGARWGIRRPDTGARVTFLVAAVAWVAVAVLQGKFYYPGPAYPPLAALGSVALEALTARWLAARPARQKWLRPALVAGLVLPALPFVPATLPLLPRAWLVGPWGDWASPTLADQLGWPELAAQVAAIYRRLPPDERAATTVLTANYAEAAAIELLSPLPAGEMPVACPHNTYWYWGPGGRDPQTLILVGPMSVMRMEAIFGPIEEVGIIDNPIHVSNYEWRHRIYLCRHPKQTLRAAWPGLKAFQ